MELHDERANDEFDREFEAALTAMMNDEASDDGFEWAVVEIFGHRKHAGKAREEERFGSKMLRIDVPTLSHESTDTDTGKHEFIVAGWTTHFYGGSALFSYSVTDEETVMRANRPYVAPYRARLADYSEKDIMEQMDG